MSIWASIHGEDPVIYDSGYGEDIEPTGFLDVAVSCLGDRVRIIARCDNDDAISLDADGLKELHRRIVQARSELERRDTWLKQRARSASSSDSSSDGTSQEGADDALDRMDG